MAQQQRHSVYLPRHLAERFDRRVGENGTVRSAVAYHLLCIIARLAVTHPEVLPKERRAPRGALGRDPVEVPWSQGKSEYDRFVAAIEAAGSTLSAAMRFIVEAYDAAGGDPLAMDLGHKSTLRRVA